FDDFGVEERRAQLQRGGHRGAVGFDQDVVGEVASEIVAQRFVDGTGLARRFLEHLPERDLGRGERAEFRSQQRSDLGRQERGEPGRVAQRRRRVDAAEELFQSKVEAHVARRRRQQVENRLQGRTQRPWHEREQRGGAVREEWIVAGKQLVAAVAGQRDLDVLAGELREQESGKKRRIGERLVELRDGRGQEI